MDYISLLQKQCKEGVGSRDLKPGVLQLMLPIFFEDGDMMDIYLDTRDPGNGMVRVCDLGMTLMRLSYNYEIDTPNKERVFKLILSENRVNIDNGSLYVDCTAAELYSTVLRLSQTISKVVSMRLYKRDQMQSMFYEHVRNYVLEKLRDFEPVPE